MRRFACCATVSGRPISTHGREYAEYRTEDIRAFCRPSAPAYEEVSYYYYVQFCLHEQLLAASDYARAKGIILKGGHPHRHQPQQCGGLGGAVLL